jgi:hypothetical protein
MPQLEVGTKVTGEILSAQVWLEGHRIELSNVGGVWQGTKKLNVSDGEITVVFQGGGVAGSDWEVTLTDSDTDSELFKRKGKIQKSGNSLVVAAVKLNGGKKRS